MRIVIMLVVMVGVIWFMQRSQKKQAQERQNQLQGLSKGDEVVTIGGLYGIVDEVDNDAKKMVLDIDGVYLTFELSALKRIVKRFESTSAEIIESDTTDEEISSTSNEDVSSEDIEEQIKTDD